jgi:hypothetical protein
MGLGWSPFDYGSWYQDPFFGYTFVGNAPWGWLPYHYGGWLFSPGYGWVWAPVGFGGYAGPGHYHPVTATWVRNGSTLGIVPLHPGDKYGKTAQNLNRGIYPVQNSQIARSSLVPDTGKWSVLHRAPGEVLASNVASSSAPARVSRTVLSGTSTGNRVVNFGRESSIAYDPVEHRYVNSGNLNAAQRSETRDALPQTNNMRTGINGALAHGPAAAQIPARPGIPVTPATARIGAPPRGPATPAPARTSGGGFPSRGGGATWGGGSSGGSHPSFGGGGSGSGAHPSAGSGGGGSHPH